MNSHFMVSFHQKWRSRIVWGRVGEEEARILRKEN